MEFKKRISRLVLPNYVKFKNKIKLKKKKENEYQKKKKKKELVEKITGF